MVGSRKLIIALMIDYYSPGFKAGGPITTIKNMLRHLGGEFEFRIITRCHDLGDEETYSDIDKNSWMNIDGDKIYYLGQSETSLSGIKQVLNSFTYDILYLNSVFSIPFSLYPIILSKLGIIDKRRIILAPRGEFSEGALGLSPQRKKIYLALSKVFGFYRNVNWQASSEYEKADIIRLFSQADIAVSPDLPPEMAVFDEGSTGNSTPKVEGELKLLFLSRISKMKGLYEAIMALKEQSAIIDFDIYGPIEDKGYWEECQALAVNLPENVKFSYKGGVKPDEVPALMSSYHLFILPTKGENFGHVVIEALGSGCPVLISDQTQWKGLEVMRSGFDVPLTKLSKFSLVVDIFAKMPDPEWQEWSRGAQRFVSKKVNVSKMVEKNRLLFSANINE